MKPEPGQNRTLNWAELNWTISRNPAGYGLEAPTSSTSNIGNAVKKHSPSQRSDECQHHYLLDFDERSTITPKKRVRPAYLSATNAEKSSLNRHKRLNDRQTRVSVGGNWSMLRPSNSINTTAWLCLSIKRLHQMFSGHLWSRWTQMPPLSIRNLVTEHRWRKLQYVI